MVLLVCNGAVCRQRSGDVLSACATSWGCSWRRLRQARLPLPSPHHLSAAAAAAAAVAAADIGCEDVVRAYTLISGDCSTTGRDTFDVAGTAADIGGEAARE
jgi:hypothetical protein